MELKMEVYTPSLELVGVLEEYQSAIWEEKAFSAGSFSVEALLTERTRELLAEENILWIGGDVAGTIEHYDKTADAGAYITVKGRLLTGILDKRILWGLYDLNGTPPEIMRYLVSDCAVDPTRGDIEARKIPGLVLLDAPAGGEKIRIQKTGGSLLEELELIGAAYHVPFGVRFNPAVPRMEFWTRWGQDRSINQNENEHVFYSTQLDDVLSSEYSYDSTGWRNVALVAGEGEGKDRQMVVVEEDVPEPPAPPEPPGPPELEKFTITLSVDPAGGGVVSGGGRFDAGAFVTVTAVVSDGYTFVGWRENGDIVSTDLSYTFPADGDRSLTAVFSAIPVHTVSISIDPDGSGTVTGGGTYQEGETATVTAVPADGYKFAGWQENGVTYTTDTTFTFEVLSDWALVAVFEVANASKLPTGYVELEYIHTNAVCGFNTGLTPKQNKTRIIMDLEAQTSVETLEYFFSIIPESSYAFYLRRGTVHNFYVRTIAVSSSTEVSLTSNIVGKRSTIECNLVNKTINVGGVSKTLSIGSRALTNPIYLFSSYNFYNTANVKLYSCQIYEENEVKRDFVPCMNPAGTVGLYDLIEGNFCQNAHGNAVTPGPAV